MRAILARWLITAAKFVAKQVAEAALEDLKRRAEGGDRQ
jgi:hypothetical protein